MDKLRLFILITICFSGIPWSTWLLYKYTLNWRTADPSYLIAGIVQRPGSRESLKTSHLAELLHLSVDQPVNLYALDLRKAEQQLLSIHVFKNVRLKRINPSTLYIDYSLRTPIAFLGDYSNMALDEEGYLFPFRPFFTPKKLPEIYLQPREREEEYSWGQRLQGKNFRIALQLFHLLSDKTLFEGLFLQRLDLSKIDASSYGQREIVGIVEERIEKQEEGVYAVYHLPRLLRLHSEDYLQGLNQYLELRKILNQKDQLGQIKDEHKAVVVDLRIPQLAFIPKEYIQDE